MPAAQAAVTTFHRSGGSGPGKRALTRGELLAGVPALTAVASAATALAGAPQWVPGLLALVTLAVMTWAVAGRPSRPAPSSHGVYVSLRALVSVALVALILQARAEDRAMVWVTGAALLLLLLPPRCGFVRPRGSSGCRCSTSRRWAMTSPTPSSTAGCSPWGSHRCGCPSCCSWSVVRCGSPRPWPSRRCFAAAFALVRAVQVLRASDRASAHLRGAIEAYRPEFVVYFAAQTGAKYQLGMWMPYFESLGKRFIVVTRFERSNAQIAEITRAPIVLCRTLESLEDTLVPSVRAAFYVNNGLKNTHYVERRELTHVWLNHGDSEKPACFNPVHAIYDKIFTAGQAGVDRYARHGVDISPEKFEIVGRPQVERHRRGDDARSSAVGCADRAVRADLGRPLRRQQALLPAGRRPDRPGAPRPRLHCRLPGTPDELPVRRGTPLHRTHLGAAAGRPAADRAALTVWGRVAEKDMDLKDCFNASDAMISDVSAVVTDYLQSQKPFAMVAVDSNSDQLMETAPVAVASYVLAGDLSNLSETLDQLLATTRLPAGGRTPAPTTWATSTPRTPRGPSCEAARRCIAQPTSVPAALSSRAEVVR